MIGGTLERGLIGGWFPLGRGHAVGTQCQLTGEVVRAEAGREQRCTVVG
jgi:hypothetical protein